MKSKHSASESAASLRRAAVFIVEDHPVFREGLTQIINGEEDLFVCGMAGNALQARRAIKRLKPDLVLVDITLPGKNGLALIKELRAGGEKAKVLVVSMHDEALYAARALRAGGNGYIMKQQEPGELVHAIRDVLRGDIYLSEEVLARGGKSVRKDPTTGVGRPLDLLTDSDLEVLEWVGKGKTNLEIGRQLGLSAREVESQTTRARKKLKLKSINSLIHFATCWVETRADEAG